MGWVRLRPLPLLFALIVLNGCASGRVRSASQSDRIPARQSSYRIHGTTTVGMLSETQKAKLRAKTRAWRWPTNYVVVTSNFGNRGSEHHDGIDLRASTGTPVFAAYDGKVIYAGSKISGYGRMIVIRHEGKLSTIYAHNSKLYVHPGQIVRRGQTIASSGNTGRSSGPHVHFEVREGVTAINPLLLLPPPAVANEASRRIASGSHYSQTSPKRVGGTIAARVAQDDGFQPKSPRANPRD
jgi:murein DD-endopeptidase MepM/ murein hydrolase activator NlpD